MKIKNSLSLWRAVITGLVFCLYAFNSNAQITSLCDATNPCHVSGEISGGAAGRVQITWRGRAEVERNAALVSDSGQFSSPGNQALGTANSPLRQTLMANAIGAPVPFTVSETLTVPAQISSRAAALGATEIVFTRSFHFEGTSAAASVRIAVNQPLPNASTSLPEGSEPHTSALGLTRVALEFSSGKQVEIIDSNAELNALATINFERAGMFNAVWEVATPASTAGLPVYQTLHNVRQYLGAGGQAVIRSPSLPGNMPGNYRVRLRILQTQTPLQALELRYYVNAAPEQEQTPVKTIKTLAPSSKAVLGEKSEFAWPAQTGAVAYQLEIYSSKNADKPVSGLLLNQKQTRSPLSASVLANLERGRVYYWRVIAVDAQGKIFASSPRKEFSLE